MVPAGRQSLQLDQADTKQGAVGAFGGCPWSYASATGRSGDWAGQD